MRTTVISDKMVRTQNRVTHERIRPRQARTIPIRCRPHPAFIARRTHGRCRYWWLNSRTQAKRGKKKPKKITICSNGQTLKVRKKDWQSHYPGATVGACTGPTDVCANCSETCFATLIVPDQDPNTLEYACCPAESVCISQTPPYPDQCCYEGDACDPTLPLRDFFADMICCRHWRVWTNQKSAANRQKNV